MVHKKKEFFFFSLFVAVTAVALFSASSARAENFEAPSSGAKVPDITIVSTEFKYTPATVRVPAGREVTIILDNSGAETEHGFFLPALGFRLEAKAGEITRWTAVFDKPGEYEFSCDLPGHRDAGMEGTLIVSRFPPEEEDKPAVGAFLKGGPDVSSQ